MVGGLGCAVGQGGGGWRGGQRVGDVRDRVTKVVGGIWLADSKNGEEVREGDELRPSPREHGVAKAEAEEIKKQLEEAGAKVALK